MGNDEDKFFEICRIKIAKELNIPPDDIDIEPIINCAKRAIIEACGRNDDEGAIISPLTDREKTAIFSSYGPDIIQKMFSGEQPFGCWVEKFEENYVRTFLEKINKQSGH